MPPPIFGRKPKVEPQRAHKSVLIVDDEDLFRESLCDVFETLGIQAEGVSNGPEALKRIESGEPFDLVVLDVVMPVMDGTELLRKIKEIRPCQRILFISGYISVDIKAFAKKFNADTLRKPFTTAELKDKIPDLVPQSGPYPIFEG